MQLRRCRIKCSETGAVADDHIAVMAATTNLGAATSVQIGGIPKTPTDPTQPAEEEQAVDGKTSMERKVINDATAYILGLAQLRDRNAEWARMSSADSLELFDLNHF